MSDEKYKLKDGKYIVDTNFFLELLGTKSEYASIVKNIAECSSESESLTRNRDNLIEQYSDKKYKINIIISEFRAYIDKNRDKIEHEHVVDALHKIKEILK